MATKQRKGKRGHGEGTIDERRPKGALTQLADGRWQARLTLANGKRKAFYGKTKEEARKKLIAAQADRERGLPTTNDRQTVRDFLDRWLEDAAKPKVRPRTYASYRQQIKLHILPAIGKQKLTQLSPTDVQAYMNQKLASGLSPRTVQYHRAILRRALGQALKWGDVVRNVATLVDPPKVERHEVEPLTPEQARVFLAAAKGHRYEALYTVALALGLRQGEALGLRWEDVDLDRATLRVRAQLQRIDGKLRLTEPKSKRSRRLVSLPAFAVDALREHRVRQLQERLLAGSRWQDHGLVFPSTIGTPMDARNLVTQYHRLLEQAGLPRKRFHDLRHTCATLLLIQGEDLNVVKEVLGHSQISLTADTYQHVAEALKRGAADRMQALLGAER